jgi:biotin transport system substrate-specific component
MGIKRGRETDREQSPAGILTFQREIWRVTDMARSTTQILTANDHALDWAGEAAIVVAASLFVALCSRVTLFLPGTPVPLTLGNFGVLLVGLTLGSRRGFAALALFLFEGALGLPVFAPSPTGLVGIAQVLGPTGGYLIAYPFVAGLAGWIMEQGKKSFARATAAGVLAEILLFAGGIGWLAVLTHSFGQALRFGLYWFVFAEILKIASAAALAQGWQRIKKALP